MDSIMHYTDGTLTLIATASFVIAFILGSWAGAKWKGRILIPSIVIALGMFFLRSQFPPLSFIAIASVTVLHVAAGALTARLVARFQKP